MTFRVVKSEQGLVFDPNRIVGIDLRHLSVGEKSRFTLIAAKLQDWVYSQDVHPQHPPHEKQGNDGPHDVNYPVANRFRFSKIEHAAW